MTSLFVHCEKTTEHCGFERRFKNLLQRKGKKQKRRNYAPGQNFAGICKKPENVFADFPVKLFFYFHWG